MSERDARRSLPKQRVEVYWKPFVIFFLLLLILVTINVGQLVVTNYLHGIPDPGDLLSPNQKEGTVFHVLGGVFMTIPIGIILALLMARMDSEKERITLQAKNLEETVAERTKELEVAKTELEKKIIERTRQLRDKVTELELTRTATLNMLDDLDEKNRELGAAKLKLQVVVDELKALDIKKNEFISITSHELKTPITSIKGFTQILMKKESGISNKYKKFLEIVDSEATRLSKIISDILDLSKLDLKTIKFSYEKVHVKGFLVDIVETMKPRMKKGRLRTKLEVEKNLDFAMLDTDRVEQILFNLLTNAIKFSPPGGIVRIYARKKGSFVRLSIQDGGRGIPKKEQKKIFSRFYQVDSSHTRNVGGTGLGLTIVKELTEAMGGKVLLESSAGKGATFHINLPIRRPGNKK